MKQNEFIHFRAPITLKERTKEIAKEQGMRYSEWLRYILTEEVQKQTA